MSFSDHVSPCPPTVSSPMIPTDRRETRQIGEVMIRFSSDYTEGAHPSILPALTETNYEQNPGYSEDPHCAHAAELIRKACGSPDAAVHLKPAAAIASARRAGTTATFDQMNKYFTISEMPIISSRYWNMVHGATAEDVQKDGEGLWTMRVLARNMAYHLKCKEAAAKLGIEFPRQESPIVTNFIR